MTIQNLAVVFLRLTALNTLILGITRLGPSLAVTFLRSGDTDVGIGGIGFALVIIAVAVAIWLTAPWFGKKVSSGHDSPVHIEGLTLKNLYSLVILGVGIFYVIGYLAPTLNWLHYFFTIHSSPTPEEDRRQNFYGVFESAVPFILGLMAVFFSNRWAELILQKQKQTDQNSVSRQ